MWYESGIFLGRSFVASCFPFEGQLGLHLLGHGGCLLLLFLPSSIHLWVDGSLLNLPCRLAGLCSFVSVGASRFAHSLIP